MAKIIDTLKDIVSLEMEARKPVPDYAWDAASQAGAVERVKEKLSDSIRPGDEYKALPGEAMYLNVTKGNGPGVIEGQKHDQKKTWRPGLIAVEFIQGIATVLAFGAHKYSAGNWALGMDWSRPIDAFDRHWTAWKGGEKFDPETGYSHLWHAGCCLMFLVAYEARGIGRDDRAEVGMMKRGGNAV